MNNQPSPQAKTMIGLILMFSGLAMMIGPFVIPAAAQLGWITKFVIALAGLMDLIFGLFFLFMGRSGR